MDRQVDMFVNITGASEADARYKLRAFGGDLNAAIDSYLSEKENFVSPVQVEEAHMPVWVNEDEPPPRRRISPSPFYRFPSALAWASGRPRFGGFGIEGAMAPPFPYRGTSPIVTQPRDMREIPIDWRDGESRVQSSAALLIEEIPATAEESLPSQRPVHFITEAEEDTGPLPSAFRGGSDSRPRIGENNMDRDFAARHTDLNAPPTNEVTTMVRDEGDDIEEDILRAVIEASRKETRGMGISESAGGAGCVETEDDDFARAVSLSLKDNEYLASLVADREKEQRAQLQEEARCLKEAEAKTAAHVKKTLQEEEELCKCLTEVEVQKQVAAKQAALPEEPSVDDDSAVTLMVRMPDGTRRGRRFRKSDSLQCLLNFIDVNCGPLPGAYQLVRPYPRKAFSDAEHGNSFQELGLNSKYETLFLELI